MNPNAQSWDVECLRGVVTLSAGQRVKFDHEAADFEWEIVGATGEYVDDGETETPVINCRQVGGDQSAYARDRKEDGSIDLCGDSIALAVMLAQGAPNPPETPDR